MGRFIPAGVFVLNPLTRSSNRPNPQNPFAQPYSLGDFSFSRADRPRTENVGGMGSPLGGLGGSVATVDLDVAAQDNGQFFPGGTGTSTGSLQKRPRGGDHDQAGDESQKKRLKLELAKELLQEVFDTGFGVAKEEEYLEGEAAEQ